MWVPRWAGEGYARLYSRFGRGVFSFREALDALKVEEAKAHLLFSALRKTGALIDFRRSRPRLYRLLDPRSFMLLAAGAAERSVGLQGEYIQLVYDAVRALRKRWRLTSLLVYGSVARGEASPYSDLDLLLVSEDFRGSMASRIDQLLEIEKDSDITEELGFLRSQGIWVKLSFYPLRREEAERIPVLFLDLIHDSAVIIDDGFMRSLLSKLKLRLEAIGAERRRLPGGRWYWDLGPRAAEVWAP